MLNELTKRQERLKALFSLIEPVPAEWLKGAKSHQKNGEQLELLPCSDYATLVNAWRKAMKWTDGLNHALSTMLATITSTMSIGSQLWVTIISPPSTGKSVLCEAVSCAEKWVIAKSTLTGFYSGYGEADTDYSLISRLAGKTLVIKDADPILKSAAKEQILAEARDLYDTVSRPNFKNKKTKDYKGIRCTVIFCGTSALRELDSTELGARFLTCTIMDEIDDELEDEVSIRVAHRMRRGMAIEANGEAVSQQDPDMTRAMQLTGGYVEWLRKNAFDLFEQIDASDDVIRLCARFGKFVAFMRARPSKRQDEKAEREFAARLVEQHTRLAMCLPVVWNKKSVDEQVIANVRRIAMDTARGQTLDILRKLYQHPEGMTYTALADKTKREEYSTQRMVSFLNKIGVVEWFYLDQKGATGLRRWRLTTKLRKLYEEIRG